MAVELAAALCIAGTLPVGGLVASATETLFFYEGFEENGAVAVALEPVVWKSLGGLCEELRG